MSQIKGHNTAPEIYVRKVLHSLGYRFRLHVDRLPGKPDIVLPRHKKVVFVHGCFWHGHKRCNRSKRPASNKKFWNEKIDKTIKRDTRIRRQLKTLGWDVLVIWQCQTKKEDFVKSRLMQFLKEQR